MVDVDVGTSWVMVNWWSSATGVQDFVAQVSVWARVSSQSVASNKTSRVDFKYRTRMYSPSGKSFSTYQPRYWNYTAYKHKITCSGHSASATFAVGEVNTEDWSDVSIPDTSDLWWGDVAHNNDGTCTVSYTATGARVNGEAYSEGGNITFPTIPRASVPTVSKNTVVLNGTDSVVVTTNRKSTSFTHTLTFTAGGFTATVTGVGASYTWTPNPATWMQYMQAKDNTVTLKCTTYNGSTQIGSTTQITFTLQIDTTVYTPVIGTTSAVDTNPTTLALETAGSFIVNGSWLTVTANFTENTSDYGSALASAKVTCGDQSQTFTLSGASGSITAEFTNKITSNQVQITVTDNWGVTQTRTLTLTAINYAPIKIKTIKVERTNDQGDVSETGECLTYTIGVEVFQGSFGQASNIITVKDKYKTPSTSYTEFAVVGTDTPAGTGYAAYTVTGTTADDYDSALQYDVIFQLEDALSTATSGEIRIHPGVPVFAWGKDHFDVYGELHLHSRTNVLDYITLGPNSVFTQNVTFSGAVGGTASWTVFAIGKLRVAVCKWRATTSAVISDTWAGFYTSNNFSSPNFPFTFADVKYVHINYIAGDQAYHAEVWDGGRTVAPTTTAGQFYLVRPNDGGPVTVGHPVFTEIVIGTVS